MLLDFHSPQIPRFNIAVPPSSQNCWSSLFGGFCLSFFRSCPILFIYPKIRLLWLLSSCQGITLVLTILSRFFFQHLSEVFFQFFASKVFTTGQNSNKLSTFSQNRRMFVILYPKLFTQFFDFF